MLGGALKVRALKGRLAFFFFSEEPVEGKSAVLAVGKIPGRLKVKFISWGLRYAKPKADKIRYLFIEFISLFSQGYSQVD